MMAASVLGKRTRRTFDAEDISLPIQTRKRRARNATPYIHSDEQDVSKSQAHQDAPRPVLLDDSQQSFTVTSRPTPTHTVSTKHTIQNETEQKTTSTRITTSFSEQVSDENAPPHDFATPTTSRFRDALSGKIPITPRHRHRIAGSPSTPRTPRTTPTSRVNSVYAEAKALFTPGTPGKMIGRDVERQQLLDVISQATSTKSGGCTYVSGPPGTGKSALVKEVFESLQPSSSLKCTFINCVSIRTPKDVHDRLLQDFCPTTHLGQKSPKETLANLFTAKARNTETSYLVVLDEIDSLLDTDCEVLYTLFDWALRPSSTLLLIGIANALDLTDRFLPRLKARNLKPRLLPFHPYTAREICEIISKRLRSTLPSNTSAAPDYVPFLHPAAIQLSSKKVASQTGDLRKAFSLVRRAIDQVERETLDKVPVSNSPSKQPLAELINIGRSFPPPPVKSSPLKCDLSCLSQSQCLTPENAPRATIAHIARLSSAIFNNGTTSRLGGLNLQQKAVLSSLVANESIRSERDPFMTPSKSTGRVLTVRDLFAKYVCLCKREDCLLQPLKITEFRDVVASLETLGLVHESTGRTSSLLTPTQTPSRAGRNPDDKQIVSGVSKKEMLESLAGPGVDLLLRLFDE